MSEPNFVDFINQKIAEEPHEAEANEAILSLYSMGLVEVQWSEHHEDFVIRLSGSGRDLSLMTVVDGITPAEA